MSFTLQVQQFEGPLDLMLHLVKENKLDLFDLDLVVLCDQYIAYIRQMSDNQLNIASSYLSELAGLIELKSKRLLPKHQKEETVVEEQEDNLVKRLLEYQQYKEATLLLQKQYEERLVQFNLIQTQQIAKQQPQPTVYDHDIYDLIKAMNKVLLRQQKQQLRQVILTKKEYSIDDRIDEIRHYLKTQVESFLLQDLMQSDAPLEYQIVTFLAVLDMIRMHELSFSIEEDAIYLKGRTT